jgi:hypothetical protein
MKMRFSIHSSTPRLLERLMNEDPHFEHTKNFMTNSIVFGSVSV